MLVLSRQLDESISIKVPGYPPIIVTVVGLRGDKCRLGFDAPRAIVIDRLEVASAIAEGPNALSSEHPKSIFEEREDGS